jgi:putative transposase
LSAHTKTDLKVHLVWVPKYRKRILTGQVAIRVRDIIRQIAMEHELNIITGKVACDHVHLFISYKSNQDISKIVQWIKGISSRIMLQEFMHLRKMFWGKHFYEQVYVLAA